MNGYQSALHWASVFVDVSGALAGTVLFEGMRKTYDGIDTERLPREAVIMAVSRTAFSLGYGALTKNPMSGQAEILGTTFAWFLIQSKYQNKPFMESLELYAYIFLAMASFSRILQGF